MSYTQADGSTVLLARDTVTSICKLLSVDQQEDVQSCLSNLHWATENLTVPQSRASGRSAIKSLSESLAASWAAVPGDTGDLGMKALLVLGYVLHEDSNPGDYESV